MPGRAQQLILLFLIVVALGVILRKVSRHIAPRSVHMRWNYDYRNDRPCTSRWEEGCIRGFNVFATEKGGRSHQVFVDNRFDKDHRVVGEGLETTLQMGEFGFLQFCVVAVKQGPMATTVESVPVCSRRLVLPLRITRARTR